MPKTHTQKPRAASKKAAAPAEKSFARASFRYSSDNCKLGCRDKPAYGRVPPLQISCSEIP
jgi:hypothetical protein